MRLSCALVLASLVSLFSPLLSPVQAEVVGWRASTASAVFSSGLAFRVSLVSGGSDLTVQWRPSSNFSHIATLLRVCNFSASCTSRYLPPPPPNQNATSEALLKDFVPVGVDPANLTVSLADASTNATLPDGSDWFYVDTNLGRHAYQVNLSPGAGSDGYKMGLSAITLNYTCQWTACVDDAANQTRTVVVTAPLSLNHALPNSWECVVPKGFDNRLPAGTNFTMALLSDSGVVPPPPNPVVLATGAVATDLALPKALCAGSNVSVEGFFFESRHYGCSFMSSSGGALTTEALVPVSPTLIVCPLPEYGTSVSVSSVEVWEFWIGVRLVGSFDEAATFYKGCGVEEDNDEWPWWSWIIVGLGAVGGLTVVMGVTALVYVTRCRRPETSPYERLLKGSRAPEDGYV